MQRHPPFVKGAVFTSSSPAGHTVYRKRFTRDTASRGFDAMCRKWFKCNFKLSANPLNNEVPRIAEIKARIQVPVVRGTWQWFSLQCPQQLPVGVMGGFALDKKCLPEVIWFCISYRNESHPEEKSNPFPYWEWKVCLPCLCCEEFHFSKNSDRNVFPWRGWEKPRSSLLPYSLSLNW